MSLPSKLKRVLERIRGDEGGYILPTVLGLVVLVSSVIPPVLSAAGTTLKSVVAEERRSYEYYAADSGFQYAIPILLQDEEAFDPVTLPAQVNGKNVTVSAVYLGSGVFQIVSTGSTDETHEKVITSHVQIFRYPSYWDNSISALNDIQIQPGCVIEGDVEFGGELDNKGTITGETNNVPPPQWPDTEELSLYYWVESPTTDETTIDIWWGTESSPCPIWDPFLIEEEGPVRATAGLTLTSNYKWAELQGTLYVEGDLDLQPGVNLILNEQTIFVTGNINIQPNASLSGSGIIIAVGDIQFQPNLVGEDFVFLMSLEGEVDFQPGNSFYGSIAGDTLVYLQPGCTINPADPNVNLDFPENPLSDSVAHIILDYSFN